jgi:hypothetical protein
MDMSFITGTVSECIYASTAAGATLTTFTSEAQLNTTGTMGVAAHLPPDFWLPNQTQVGRGIKVVARGILSSTATPTYTINIRSGAFGAASFTTAIIAGTPALTTGSTVTNQIWELEAAIVLTAIGGAGTNSTVRGMGTIRSPGLNPVIGAVWGGGASPGTVATVDTSITNYINVSAACSASSASNTITLDQLLVFGLN